MLTQKDLFSLLEQSGIAYENYEHAPVYTMEDLAAQNIPHAGQIVKNLFLRDDKKRNYYLVTLAGDKAVDLKLLSQNIPSRKLSFANEETLWELLKLEKGHVTPLGVLNNEQKNVTVVFDTALIGNKIGVHPLVNTATVFLLLEDIKKLIEQHGNTVVMCDIG